MKKCPYCAEEIKIEAIKCKHCGEWLQNDGKSRNGPIGNAQPQATKPQFEANENHLELLNRDKSLSNYVCNANGLEKSDIYIFSAIGFFLFGFVYIFSFSKLGKTLYGVLYFIGAVFAMANLPRPFNFISYIVIWIAGMAHAINILSRYQSSARKILNDIDNQDKMDIDISLIKGILIGKVLWEPDHAAGIMRNALQFPGGNPELLNLAGLTMRLNKKTKTAEQLYRRALSNATDQSLIIKIKENLASIGIDAQDLKGKEVQTLKTPF